MDILIPVLVLGGMALVFGVALTYAAKLLAVPHDPRQDTVREALPGANCAACGFPGCDACAAAIAAGKAPTNTCPVGGAEVATKVAAIMGVKPIVAEHRKVARVLCQGDAEKALKKFEYTGIQDCTAASTVNDGFKACKFACLGLGTCVRACRFNAIHVDPVRKIAVVDEDKCTACGMCITACPKGVIALQNAEDAIVLLCRNTDKGKQVIDVCKVGCIACGKCARSCEYGAIIMEGNLPRIDHEKCQKCMKCAEVCPTSAIKALHQKNA